MPEPNPKERRKDPPENSVTCSTGIFVEVSATLLPEDDPVFLQWQKLARERFARRRQENEMAEEREE